MLSTWLLAVCGFEFRLQMEDGGIISAQPDISVKRDTISKRQTPSSLSDFVVLKIQRLRCGMLSEAFRVDVT